jgi:hypothetical protein
MMTAFGLAHLYVSSRKRYNETGATGAKAKAMNETQANARARSTHLVIGMSIDHIGLYIMALVYGEG